MKLSEENANLFFKLMLPLLAYVNRKLELLPEVSTLEDFEKISFGDKAVIRDGLYENIHLIDSFIDENLEEFPMKELAVVASWKNFIKGDFYIERFLKKHAVFISDDDKVYAVLSLRNSLDEMIPAYALPIRVRTVLLRFQDEIVYDGFIAPYQITFGSGYREDLKRIYLKAKKQDKIIFSLNPDAVSTQTKKISKSVKNWKPEIKELVEKASTLRGGSGQSEILSPTFSLVKASLELADLATEKKIAHEEIYKCFEKIERHFNNIQKELYYLDD
jgi:hypothetical protein